MILKSVQQPYTDESNYFIEVRFETSSGLFSIIIDFVANSTPIVIYDYILNSSFVYRSNKFDLPTPESPISTTFSKKSNLSEELRVIYY